MAGPRQFSLGYLFVEMFWAAAALGCFVNATDFLQLPLTIVGVICAGAFLGGLFGGKGMLVGFGIPAFAIVAHVLLRILLLPNDWLLLGTACGGW